MQVKRSSSTVPALAVRPMRERDADVALALVNADRLRGQPEVTAEMLSEAVAGRAAVDEDWWAELRHPVAIDVAENGDGIVVGVVSYASRPRDDAGIILWLHCLEQSPVAARLIDHAVAELAGSPIVDAFDFATALSLGLEALPVRHRPVTAAALRARGFAETDLWRYMHRELPAPELPRATRVVVDASDRASHRLMLRDGDQLVAEATIGDPQAGIGVLWWIQVDPAARGQGFGRALLGSALELLVDLGAEQVILYVDDDDPGAERDRTAANRLYDAAGFSEIDRLHSFQLQARAAV